MSNIFAMALGCGSKNRDDPTLDQVRREAAHAVVRAGRERLGDARGGR